ncbi:MAG: hypothetical protein PHR47_02045 [Candidatus Pacebacteria bacterium]|nr:hypothetical protein [Candidatus Paceibacterota bacterium]
MKKIIYYLSRTLAVLIVGFFALFILEGFSPDFGWQDGLMHALLTVVILGITIVAWKWPKIGGWFFVALGTYYLVFSFREWQSGLIIGIIPLFTGILFLVEGFKKS